MTFQNSKITKSTNFEIIVEDQKMYFSDYPDFPLFEETLIPVEITSKFKLKTDQIQTYLVADKSFLQSQYQLLLTEFSDINTPEGRKHFLEDRTKNDRETFERYDELMDPNYSNPAEDKEKINEEARQLHYYIKYVLSQPDPIQEFEVNCMYALQAAIENQGLSVDFFTGEITHVTT